MDNCIINIHLKTYTRAYSWQVIDVQTEKDGTQESSLGDSCSNYAILDVHNTLFKYDPLKYESNHETVLTISHNTV